MLKVNETYLTPQEVADLLKVTRRTVYRWIESGELPVIRFGSAYRITESDLEDFIRRHRTVQAPPEEEE
jgi:excisionase family DNA binding protein